MDNTTMKRFRIIALDYEMPDGFSGTLRAKPEVSFAVASNSERAKGRCRYHLDIAPADGVKGSFKMSITGEGIFELNEPAGVFTEEEAKPCIFQTGKLLMERIEKLTEDFGVKPLKLQEGTPEM